MQLEIHIVNSFLYNLYLNKRIFPFYVWIEE